jgi:hypothetical protein
MPGFMIVLSSQDFQNSLPRLVNLEALAHGNPANCCR